MKYTFKKYEDNDFIRIRDFIRNSFQKLGKPNSWLIDRWEFVYYLQETRTGNLPCWLDEIGIWEDEKKQIVAVVCTDWDVFFLLDTLNPSKELARELITYAETNLFRVNNEGIKEICISIPEGIQIIESIATSQCYESKWQETIISIPIDKDFKSEIPSTFELKVGMEVTDQQKALGHIMAFDYYGTKSADLTLQHYGNLKNAPDYRSDLDLYLTDENGDVASFCTLWYDTVNQIGIFEPVGTHKKYRKMGLGKAVMYEGLNRLKALGATKAYVGANQPFYEKIGFVPELYINKWFKTM